VRQNIIPLHILLLLLTAFLYLSFTLVGSDLLSLISEGHRAFRVGAEAMNHPVSTISSQLDTLRSLLDLSELVERDAPGYKDAAAPWSVWADQRPPLVVQPTSLDSMSKTVKYLYGSDLDFAIRNTGTGSVSARDVILSTHGFKDFAFDREAETLTIGSGFSWGEVDRLMEKEASEWQVVGARCDWVGVAGSSLVGGLSWLSHEYGASLKKDWTRYSLINTTECSS
jgi:hypothetical protein